MTKRINGVKIIIGFAAIMAMVTTTVPVSAANVNSAAQVAKISYQQPAFSAYKSRDGWKTQYDRNCFEVNETRDGAYFVYTGDCAGSCYVGLSVISGKSPTEVLGEKTESWNSDSIIRSEGFFYGDNWAYSRRLNPQAGEVPVYQMYEAAEYNGKVFLIEVYQTMGNDVGMNSNVSDSLSMILDTIEFDYFNPQTEFSYYSGTYEYKYDDVVDGQLVTITNTITLNPDHTGKLSMQDDVNFHWGSYELYMNPTWTDRKEFTIEGDNLLVDMGNGNWVSFTRVEEEDLD